MKMKALLAIFLFGSLAHAGGGARPSYIPSEPLSGEVTAVGRQIDDRAIFLGRFDHHIVRKNVSGKSDRSFDNTWSGAAFSNDTLTIAIQTDDKVVVGGEFTSFSDSTVGYLIRLNSNGSVDNDFVNNMGTGFDGRVTSLVIDDGQRILVTGDFTSFNGDVAEGVARLNSDGTLDEAFDVGSGLKVRLFISALRRTCQRPIEWGLW